MVAVQFHGSVGRALRGFVQNFERTSAVIAVDALVLEHDGVLESVEGSCIDVGSHKALRQTDAPIQLKEIEILEQLVEIRIAAACGCIGDQLGEAILHRTNVALIRITVTTNVDAALSLVRIGNGFVDLLMNLAHIVGENIADGVQREEHAALLKTDAVVTLQIGQLVALLLRLLNGILPVILASDCIANAVDTVTNNQPMELGGDEAAVNVRIEHMAVRHHLTMEAAVLTENTVVVIVQIHREQLAGLLVADLDDQLGALGQQRLVQAQGQETIGINASLAQMCGHVGVTDAGCGAVNIGLIHGMYPPSCRSESSCGREYNQGRFHAKRNGWECATE